MYHTHFESLTGKKYFIQSVKQNRNFRMLIWWWTLARTFLWICSPVQKSFSFAYTIRSENLEKQKKIFHTQCQKKPKLVFLFQNDGGKSLQGFDIETGKKRGRMSVGDSRVSVSESLLSLPSSLFCSLIQLLLKWSVSCCFFFKHSLITRFPVGSYSNFYLSPKPCYLSRNVSELIFPRVCVVG